MAKNKLSLGIIGFGQFAQFFAPYLKPHFSKISASSRSDKRKIAKKLGIEFGPIQRAAAQDIVILSMPISEIENALTKIKSGIKPGAIIMDVCSVKIYPLKLMKKILPKNINILGAHPLFGPQSGKNGIKDLEIVLCPERIGKDRLNEIKNIFQKMGLRVILTTPSIHDKIIAETQALTHFFAKGALKSISFADKFTTPSSRKLLSIINDVKEDSPQLFRDIETLNPHAQKIRRKLLKNLNQINKKL